VSPPSQLEPPLATETLAGLLAGLYRRQLEELPGEAYLRAHSDSSRADG
jgi:hypothetical protein